MHLWMNNVNGGCLATSEGTTEKTSVERAAYDLTGHPSIAGLLWPETALRSAERTLSTSRLD